MKRKFSIILALLLLITSITGCIAKEITDKEQNGIEITASPQPAVNPLEGLSDDIREAVELGIADYELIEIFNETANQKVVAQMLKNVNDLYYGKGNSRYLADMVELAHSDWDATRFYIAQNLFYSLYEEIYDVEYTNSYEWIMYCNQNPDARIEVDAGYITRLLDGTVGEFYEVTDITDFEDIIFSDSPNSVYPLDFGNPDAVMLAIKLYDRKTGEKILEMDDHNNFNPQGTMTVGEAIELALRYYRSFPKYPVEVKYDEAGTYNKDIITDELLNKETDLPDCSSSYLPKEWKGLLVPIMMFTPAKALAVAPDDIITEAEVEVIKEAGFNYMTFSVSFSSLQEPFFNKGTVNLSQLEYMDEVLSWCIKNDIHMEIRCNTPPGVTDRDEFEYTQNFKDNVFTDAELRQDFADFWGMIAKRYANIPNKYLSFNLICEPYVKSDEDYLLGYKPIVEAIRAVSLDRCLVADVHSNGTTGRTMAELGVALSWHQYDPREFCALYGETSEYPKGYLQSVAWPYMDSQGKVWDVDAVLNEPMFGTPGEVTLLDVKDIAEEYGVGFMVGEWGIFGAPLGKILTETYNREVLYSFYEDFINAYDELGIGWVLGNSFYTEYGITCPYPAVEEGCVYVPLDGTNVYKELNMIEFFQETLK